MVANARLHVMELQTLFQLPGWLGQGWSLGLVTELCSNLSTSQRVWNPCSPAVSPQQHNCSECNKLATL